MSSALQSRPARWCYDVFYQRRGEWFASGIALAWLLGGVLLLRLLPEMAYLTMPREIYQQPVMILAALGRLPMLAALGLALVLALYGKRVAWGALELGRFPQLLVLACGLPLTWSMTTYHPNFYLDQLHATDRVLAAVLLLGTVAHPCFLPLLLTQLYLIMGQFAVPLIDANIDKQLPFELLTLAMVPPVLSIGRIRVRPSDLLLAALVILGAFYLKPGLGKLLLNWTTWNQPAYLFPNSVFQNGWLGWLSEETQIGLYRFLVAGSLPMKVATMAIELGVLLLAIHRRSAIALLLACTALHTGIFLSCGVFFWKWMIIDLAVAAYLWRLDPGQQTQLFSLPTAALAAGAMLVLMPIYKAPANLAWYDTPMASRYSIDFVGVSGQHYQVPPYRLAPFDLSFAQGRLFLADPRPKLVDCMGGVADLQLCQDLQQVENEEQLQTLLAEYGAPQFDPQRRGELQRLLQRYLAAGPAPTLALGFLPRAPQHIWSGRLNQLPVFEWQEPVATIRLRRHDGLVIDDLCQQIQESTVFTIPGSAELPTRIATRPGPSAAATTTR